MTLGFGMAAFFGGNRLLIHQHLLTNTNYYEIYEIFALKCLKKLKIRLKFAVFVRNSRKNVLFALFSRLFHQGLIIIKILCFAFMGIFFLWRFFLPFVVYYSADK